MRKFLPIVLVAILVQILAPISASWAAGAALSDPLGLSAICSAGSGSNQPDTPAAHRGCCVLCCMAQAGSVLRDLPPTMAAKRLTLPQRVVWFGSANDLPALRIGLDARARAPPLLS